MRETAPAYFGGGNALEPVHEGGASGGDSCGAGVVRGAGIADYALEVRVAVDELFAGVSVGVVVERVSVGAYWVVAIETLCWDLRTTCLSQLGTLLDGDDFALSLAHGCSS